jgi:hypothetical protein
MASMPPVSCGYPLIMHAPNPAIFKGEADNLSGAKSAAREKFFIRSNTRKPTAEKSTTSGFPMVQEARINLKAKS